MAAAALCVAFCSSLPHAPHCAADPAALQPRSAHVPPLASSSDPFATAGSSSSSFIVAVGFDTKNDLGDASQQEVEDGDERARALPAVTAWKRGMPLRGGLSCAKSSNSFQK